MPKINTLKYRIAIPLEITIAGASKEYGVEFVINAYPSVIEEYSRPVLEILDWRFMDEFGDYIDDPVNLRLLPPRVWEYINSELRHEVALANY